jgi:nickel/cobalt exporter
VAFDARRGMSWVRFGKLPVAATLLACLAVLSVAVSSAGAHPLGNTSVNVYERVEIGPESIGIRFVLDVSEIPAVKEKEFADTNDDGTVDAAESDAYLDGLWVYVAPKLILVVNDTPLGLTPERQTLSFPPGQGGLILMRAVYDITVAHPASPAGSRVDATLTETTFEGIPGWHEIVVQASAGASIVESNVPNDDITDELKTYPPDRLDDPLSVRGATFSYTLDAGSAGPAPSAASPSASVAPTPPAIPPAPGSRPGEDPLVALVGAEMSLLATLAAVGLALVLGALHALSPGHGKTLVAAYLIGTRADLRQAVGLGLTVAVTHTAGVFVLGIATYAATEWIVPDRIVRWLSVATGLLILALGALLVWRAARSRSLSAGHAHPPDHEHGHGHGHEHEHQRDSGPARDHDRPVSRRERRRRRQADGAGSRVGAPAGASVATPPTLRRRDVAALGVVGGLIPSGSALLLLLSSIALGQTALGMLLILAFGVGMAVVLAGLSTGVVLMRRSPLMGWERWRDPRLTRVASLIPVASGVVVIGFGLFLTYDAFRGLA